MKSYQLAELSSLELLRNLSTLISHERTATALILAHIAEVDRRRLYLPAGYPSMYAYCVFQLGMSEDSAFRRIQVARLAREIPGIFQALADGRLTPNAVILLSPYINAANAEGLLKEASGKRKSEIEELIAARFPRTEILPLVHALPSTTPPEKAVPSAPSSAGIPPATTSVQHAQTDAAPPQTKLAALRVDPVPPTVEPIAQQRYGVQFSISREVRDKLEHAKNLLSHRLPSGDLAALFERALDSLIEKIEKRRFGLTDTPRRVRRPLLAARTIPADVRRAVWERDEGRCTFVSESGHRCEERRVLEYDHVHPVALGSVHPSVEGIRLRCRAHNQYEAERVFGSEFMEKKRRPET